MIRYLSTTDIADRLGITAGAIRHYKLPEPDAMIGRVRGWLPETVDDWNENRPGRGNWRNQQAETQE
ncbi:XRE family transcriptional regulator [Canibacter zhoujuaniae]|uniref:XRE family transcriptional regulator n=1 Tax=Canibacter zhoujuaniae TaxID=2708343 RepID=UPI001AB027D5|nr:XRE family transcriptional regulator [Canibacter zhoujuaniae]